MNGSLKYIPNLLTVLRIAGSALLLAFPLNSQRFFVVYLLCGLTDVFDGFFARKFGAATKAGAALDSIADLMFTAICMAKILPCLKLEVWIWAWICLIAVTKAAVLLICCMRHKKFSLLHTKANRLTGLMMFVFTPYILYKKAFSLRILLCFTASVAAVQELSLVTDRKRGK